MDPERNHITDESQFCIPIKEKFRFDPKSDFSAGQSPLLGCFEALSWLPEHDFHSASVGGTTFEGSLKTFLRDLDGVGESFVAIFYQEQL